VIAFLKRFARWRTEQPATRSPSASRRPRGAVTQGGAVRANCSNPRRRQRQRSVGGKTGWTIGGRPSHHQPHLGRGKWAAQHGDIYLPHDRIRHRPSRPMLNIRSVVAGRCRVLAAHLPRPNVRWLVWMAVPQSSSSLPPRRSVRCRRVAFRGSCLEQLRPCSRPPSGRGSRGWRSCRCCRCASVATTFAECDTSGAPRAQAGKEACGCRTARLDDPSRSPSWAGAYASWLNL